MVADAYAVVVSWGCGTRGLKVVVVQLRDLRRFKQQAMIVSIM